MKQYSQRVMKVLASFVTIAMILICTVAMPVLAAPAAGNYDLKDYLDSVSFENDQVVTTYDFNSISPLLNFEVDDVPTGNYNQSDVWFYPAGTDISKYSFNFFPFGESLGIAQRNKRNLLYIKDLQEFKTLDFSCTFQLRYTGANFDTSAHIQSYYTYRFYDANFNLISSTTSPLVQYDPSLDSVSYTWTPSITLQLPSDAVYLGLSVRSSFYFGGAKDGSFLEFKCANWRAVVGIDSIFYESALMERIIDAVSDTNETMVSVDQSLWEANVKLDEIIQGDQDWTDEALEDSETQESIDSEIDSAIDDLDDKTNLDNVLPDGAKQPEDLENYVNSWIGTAGWTQVLTVFKPILQNGNFTAILFMIVAFINISVLLLGR